MPAGWDLSDDYLRLMLQAYLNTKLGETWTLHLFKNDITPFPGITLFDFTEADFPGYGPIDFPMTDFDTVAVAAHVATSVSLNAQTFVGATSGFSSQLIYGYYCTDGSDAYQISERFATPYDMLPMGVLTITQRLQHQTLPA